MTTKDIAEQLVTYCRNNQEEKAYQELYSPQITSIEMQEPMKEVHGFEGLQQKGAWWKENFEVHAIEVSDPIIADHHFTVKFSMDTTHKPSGHRSQTNEIAVYEVKEGKILKEQFFYGVEG